VTGIILGVPSPVPPTADSSMDDLTARLKSLFIRHAAALEHRRSDGVQLAHQFRKDLRMLIAEFGQPAIDVALGDLPDAASPSISIH
jgi:hypothetical protein